MPSAVHHGVLLLLRVHHQAAASRALAEQSSAALPLAQPLPETNTVSQLTATHDWHQGTSTISRYGVLLLLLRGYWRCRGAAPAWPCLAQRSLPRARAANIDLLPLLSKVGTVNK